MGLCNSLANCTSNSDGTVTPRRDTDLSGSEADLLSKN